MSTSKYSVELCETAKKLSARGKGLLAADESTNTIGKRLASISVPNTEVNRCKYREGLFKTPGLNQYISGVILFEETLYQKTCDGKLVVQSLIDNDIILGIKVDKGTRPLPFFKGDTYTQGITDLGDRCKEYYKKGCRFAKWRAVLHIQNKTISSASLHDNAFNLAKYAAICQENGLVPIVEPEILTDGDHDISVCQYWTTKVINQCYKELIAQNVILEGTLLKPNMCLQGNENKSEKSFSKNAVATITALKRSVPPAVPGIMFLSGGQSEEEATMNLNAINNLGDMPWSLSFSFGRALQRSALDSWLGQDANIKKLQESLIARAKANSEAQMGKYKGGAKGSKESLYQCGYTY